MRKLLLTAIALALAGPALAAQQDIAQLSAVTASREALRTAVNTQLSAVQSNFDEVYAVIAAGPVYVNASAPADTKVVWIDTDQSNAIKVYVGGAWTVVGSGGEGSYTLPTAAADTLGGVKVGARLTITDGVLSADVQTTDISGKENSLGNPSTSGYVLSSTTSGVRSWIEMTGGGTGIAHATSDGTYYASKDGAWATLAGVFQPADADLATAAGGEVAGNSKLFGTNASGVVGWYDIPGAGTGIAHATSDGKWYGSKDGAWTDLAPTFSSALPRWIDLATGHSFSVGDLTWYNATVWEAKTNHVKASGNYPVALSSDWQPYAAEITLDASLTETGGVLSVTNPVPVAITMNSGGDLATTGTIKGRTLFNSYAADQTLTAATHNSTVVQATEPIEITLWDCETANVGDTVLLWARDAEKIEVAPATGDGFALFDGTPLTAGNELDVAATKGTKVTLMCTADDLWSVFHETAPATDGGAAD